jgi:hypothetical protein
MCAFLLIQDARGAITRVEPFSGEYQESWESFPNFDENDDLTGNDFFPSPTAIFGGLASIAHPAAGVYEVNSGAQANLLTSGYAQAADGQKGFALASTGPQILPQFVQPAAINFSIPVTSFGGYWGAATDYLFDPEVIEFQFFGAMGNLLGRDDIPYTRSFLIDESSMVYFGDGQLQWAGWQFYEPVTRVVFSGGFVVGDYLQANPVPEPVSSVMFVLMIFSSACTRPLRERFVRR